MSKFIPVLSILALLASHSAFALNCVWTYDARDSKIKNDIVYGKKPSLVRTTCANSKDTSVICNGYLYCPGESKTDLPSGVLPVACASTTVNGKVMCPEAMTCANDTKVSPFDLRHLPSAASNDGGTGAGQGDGATVQEGVGGR